MLTISNECQLAILRSIASGLVVVIVGAQLGCNTSQSNKSEPPPDPNTPTAEDVAASFKEMRLMTPKNVIVNKEAAQLCIGVSAGLLDKLRTEFGPHAHCAINVYMNSLAAKTIESGGSEYPVGSIIVKDKILLPYRERAPANEYGRMVQPASNGVGGMIKRGEGYDPDHGNWEYFYSSESNKIEKGKIANCVDCHQGKEKTDYVFGTWLNAPPDNFYDFFRIE